MKYFSVGLCSAASVCLLWSGTQASVVRSMQQADTVRYRVAVSIDEEYDPRAGEWGELFGLAVDGKGDVYVADISNAVILVFARDGNFRGTVRRKGKGPGEFQAPTGLVVDERNDRLWVRDIEYVIRFTRDPRTGLLAKYDSAFRQPIFSAWRLARSSRIANDGSYLHVAPMGSVGGPRFALRFTPNGQQLDSLPVPPYANTPPSTVFVRTSARGGRMLPGLNHVPFAPVPAWDVTPLGTIVSGDALTYRLVETSAKGSVVREFARALQPVTIPRSELADSLSALTRRLDSVPVPLDRVEMMPESVRKKQLPKTYPAFQSVFAEPNGAVWVRRWPNERQRGQTVFDVFDADRVYRRTVVLPVEILNAPTPVLRFNAIVAVANDATTGAQRIVLFEPQR